ncbi:hypothetical protein KY284_030363 [Solanum tuberosum]|nr:hypothetical protein KY284_030363 [Solanum tuberosum]
MVSSSKSLESSGNTSSAIVSVASPPNIILVTEEGIAHIVSLNGFWSRSSIEEGHSHELPLAIISDAPSEGEARDHAPFRFVLDGLKKWCYVSHNPFLSNSTEFSSMEHEAPPVPLCIDTIDEIPLANITLTRGRNRPRSLHKRNLCQTLSLNPLHLKILPQIPLLGFPKLDKKNIRLKMI